MNVIQTILLDVSATGPLPRVWAKQGDDGTRFVAVKLVNMGAPYSLPEGVDVQLRAEKPDGNGIFNPAQITDEGLILAEMTDQVLACGGMVKADICLVDAGGGVLSSMPFEIQVVAAPQGKSIMSTNEVLALMELVAEGTQLISTLNAALAEAARCAADSKNYAAAADASRESAANSEHRSMLYSNSAAESAESAQSAAGNATASAETATAAAAEAVQNRSLTEKDADTARQAAEVSNELLAQTQELHADVELLTSHAEDAREAAEAAATRAEEAAARAEAAAPA